MPDSSPNAHVPALAQRRIHPRAGRRDPSGAVIRASRLDIASIGIAAATVVILGLTGCAGGPGSKPGSSATEPAPYVGVFTGEFVDGRPVYRFPPLVVLSSRSSLGPDF